MTTFTATEKELINKISLFAKRINYDMNNGLDKLMKLWLEDGRKFQVFVEDNKEDFMRTTKQFIK